MQNSPWLLGIAVVLLLMPLWHGLWDRWRDLRRSRQLAATPAGDWDSDLQVHSSVYRRMPLGARATTVLLARQFELMVHFAGCNGLQLTPLMRHLVCFNACVLVHARGLPWYRSLGSVLLYPGEFLAPRLQVDAAGVISESQQPLAGQAIDNASIVLSWPDVLASGQASDGYNVVVHEFAHYLDHELDGALSAPTPGSPWHAVLEREYRRLCAAADAGLDTLIDPYGSEDPAEFLAVASEAFIELSARLRELHPELHAALAGIYGFDPATWPAHA